ncbi:hypothetical protein DRP04_10885 [Archaeoglobales archaeon]|nr:MAG: hypothetical protein DRP04_10885 [Archaeoglobales archaeon]
MTSEIVRVGRKFTLVIPKGIREKLNIKEGDILSIKLEGERIILEPKRSDPFKILEKAIGEPYDEEKDEAKAERWLMDACGRH